MSDTYAYIELTVDTALQIEFINRTMFANNLERHQVVARTFTLKSHISCLQK